MHDHLYHIARPNLRADGSSEPPLLVPQMTYSSPRLYLAAGVITIRTAGSVEPYADLNYAKAVAEGRLPGPHMDVTAPYLEGQASPFLQMHRMHDAEDARRMVEYWADLGATSFKAYLYITRDELKAAIEAAHARGLKVTGHLCSVTYAEAAAIGIDNLEHGFFAEVLHEIGAHIGAFAQQLLVVPIQLVDLSPLSRDSVRKSSGDVWQLGGVAGFAARGVTLGEQPEKRLQHARVS